MVSDLRKIMLKNNEIMVYDFDGVMTDKRVLITEGGKEAVFVNRADGLGVSAVRKLGKKQICKFKTLGWSTCFIYSFFYLCKIEIRNS